MLLVMFIRRELAEERYRMFNSVYIPWNWDIKGKVKIQENITHKRAKRSTLSQQIITSPQYSIENAKTKIKQQKGSAKEALP